MRKIILALWLAFFANAYSQATIEKWQNEIDRRCLDRKVKLSILSKEYGFLRKELNFSVAELSASEILNEMLAANLSSGNREKRPSDSFLGFLFCERIGLDSGGLLKKCRYDESRINILICELFFPDQKDELRDVMNFSKMAE